MDVAAVTGQTQAMLGTLQMLSALQLTSYLFPIDRSTETVTCEADYLVVGGGSSGSIVANGLSKDVNTKVIMFEAGGDPQIESVLTSLFPYIPGGQQDYNFLSEDDGYSVRGQKDNQVLLIQGKMLGGSSSSGHTLYIRGCPGDYDEWAAAANDESWGWDSMYPYFIQNEAVLDAEILSSDYKQYHGTEGYLRLTRQPQPDIINPYMSAFQEIGYQHVLDINGNNSLGFAEPFFTISNIRESNAHAFLGPIKDRSNLYVYKNHFVTEIIFEDKKAVGVKAINKDNKEIICKAKKEVIVTAGVINSPTLLMRSGVGPKEHLESLNINVVSDLPGVGQNMQDHVGVALIYQMEKSDAPLPVSDPAKFPAPAFVGQVALDKSQSCSNYQAIGLVIGHDAPSLIPLCSSGFHYNDDICQAMNDANKGFNINFVFVTDVHPKSRGQVLLRSTDPLDKPIIKTGTYSVAEDLSNTVNFIKDYNRVLGTSYYQNISATLVDLQLSQCAGEEFGSDKYFECYALVMGTSIFHYVGTNSLGSVVDSELKVIGVSNLRVMDSSVMPCIVSNNPLEAVNAIAAKGVDLILRDN